MLLIQSTDTQRNHHLPPALGTRFCFSQTLPLSDFLVSIHSSTSGHASASRPLSRFRSSPPLVPQTVTLFFFF